MRRHVERRTSPRDMDRLRASKERLDEVLCDARAIRRHIEEMVGARSERAGNLPVSPTRPSGE